MIVVFRILSVYIVHMSRATTNILHPLVINKSIKNLSIIITVFHQRTGTVNIHKWIVLEYFMITWNVVTTMTTIKINWVSLIMVICQAQFTSFLIPLLIMWNLMNFALMQTENLFVAQYYFRSNQRRNHLRIESL